MDDNSQQPPIQWPDQQAQDNARAAEVVRHKVDHVYAEQGEPNQTTPENPSTAANTTDQTPVTPNMQAYHSAWQSYYQEYFRRYYNIAYQQAEAKRQQAAPEQAPTEPESETAHTAKELRSKLRKTINTQANRLKKNRHFKPILASLGVGFLFILVNYNQVAFGYAKQYLMPSSTANAPLIITPGTSDKVSDEPQIIIPKIGVQAPVVYNEPSYDDAKVEQALEKGVVHYGTAAMPGQNGNVVLLGHSSNNIFSAGDYKYVFVNLDRLNTGDTIYLNFQGTRYTYKVTVAHKVIQPTDMSVLANTSKPIITLITCTPAGTNLRRLIVQAEQISPSPSNNRAADDTGNQEPTKLPATTKSLWGGSFL